MKTFSYRLAAIDLDDTLLGPDKQISAANLLAIQKLQGFGVQIVLASGRKHENMARFHAVLGGTGYIISGQGALAKHAETGEIVYQAYISPALSQEVIAAGLGQGVTVLGYHDDARSMPKVIRGSLIIMRAFLAIGLRCGNWGRWPVSRSRRFCG